MPLIYGELAPWFHLLTAPADYAEEAAFYHQLLTAAPLPPRTVLELGSGGGNNASHLKAHYQLTLTDASPAMLKVSRQLNPECEHLAGDMRTLRLNRQFDAVFVHDAVMYLTSREELQAAMRTAFEHCRPGGVALFVPDCVRETFQPGTEQGGHDLGDRSLRYLEWTYDPDPADSTFEVDLAIMLKSAGEAVRVVHDHHTFGLFARQEWVELLTTSGFQVKSMTSPHASEVFVAARPPGTA